MPRSKAANEKIREATRAEILRSGIVLFSRSGYAHTSIRQIAAHAGISTGLMYHYFDGKESLLQAVFDDTMQRLSEAFTAAYESGSGPEDRIARILSTIFDMLEAEPDFWTLFYMLRTQPAVMELLGDGFRDYTGRLRALFTRELEASGRPEPELDALLLYSLIEGTIQQYLLSPADYPLERVVSRIISDFTS